MNCANHPERERVSFCQNCGKPLCTECSRAIGAGVFCEPCLAARLASADAATSSGYAVPPSYSATAVGVPPAPGTPNPVLAALLGFVPGVSAMYNGQYAKGVVHLIVFAVLVSLAADTNGVFGLLVAGWVFYQVFEGYHTAQARRDGTPLPNPFGLNDIGERFGFGKTWPSGTATPSAQTVDPSQAPPFTTVPPTAVPPNAVPPAGWGAPVYTYAYPGAPAPPTPPVPPFSDSYPDPYVDPQYNSARSRFPAGAIWMIALGLLFFCGNSGFFNHFRVQRLIPFFLIGFGIWTFFQKMTGSGQTIADDGSPTYRLRLFRALRGSVWVILVGVLFFLNNFDILPWGRSWPLFIIVAGLMTVFERTAVNAAAAIPYSYAAPTPAPQTPSATPSMSTSIVPSRQHDEEGR